MFFWHIGVTIAFVRYAFRDEAMDLRFLALGAIIPDLIDMPIGLVMWSTWETPRLWSHSMLAGSLAMVLTLIFTQRGDARKQWIAFATGVLMHLALDAIWNQPETLWWPLFGSDFVSTGYEAFGDYAVSVFVDPLMWVGEAVGVAYLLYLWKRSNLGDAEARRVLLTTGVVSAPIDDR